MFNYVRPDAREPYIQSWNLALQRQLPYQLALELAYVGNKGTGVTGVYNMNPGLQIGAGANGQPFKSNPAPSQVWINKPPSTDQNTP